MTPVPLRGLNRLDSRREIEDMRAAIDFPLPGLDVVMTYGVNKLGLVMLRAGGGGELASFPARIEGIKLR